MRDDSSIDPAGIQQPPPTPYTSGPTSEQTQQQPPQATTPQATTPQATTPQTATPQTATQQAPQAATGPGVTEPAGGATDVPATPTQTGSTPEDTAGKQAIWDTAKADEFRHRWHDVQTHFVEDPRGSVAEARQLVDEAVQSLADSVHNREEQLERAGARSSDSTEGMRDTVLQYHQLLDRLLTV